MSLTKIDWLTFRNKGGVSEGLGGLKSAFGELGPAVSLKPLSRGWNGFDEAFQVCVGDMKVGLMGHGGVHQRDWTSWSISGTGCSWISDWDHAQEAFFNIESFEPRRVDIALDTFNREVSHDTVLEAYRSGGFVTRGRPPKMLQYLPEDLTDGRSIYIGDRKQAKFLRCYEKGRELVAGFKNTVPVSHIDGVPVEDIYRVELELKPKNSDMPEDVIENRDQYMAGAYPYLGKLLSVVPQVWSQRRERGPQRELLAAAAQVKHQYGSTIFTLMHALHGDMGAVMDLIMGNKHNQSLIEKGVLLVDHS